MVSCKQAQGLVFASCLYVHSGLGQVGGQTNGEGVSLQKPSQQNNQSIMPQINGLTWSNSALEIATVFSSSFETDMMTAVAVFQVQSPESKIQSGMHN